MFPYCITTVACSRTFRLDRKSVSKKMEIKIYEAEAPTRGNANLSELIEAIRQLKPNHAFDNPDDSGCTYKQVRDACSRREDLA